MIVHAIHDLSNKLVIDLLESGLSLETNPQLAPNYHPLHRDNPANLFYILGDTAGRYIRGNGCYYVMQDPLTGQYVGSAGWNEYPYHPRTALLLTRMYMSRSHRTSYLCGQYILPRCVESTIGVYTTLWSTVNTYNRAIYNYFTRMRNGQSATIGRDWAETAPLYKNFVPAGQRIIYNTPQYILQYKHNGIHSQESPPV